MAKLAQMGNLCLAKSGAMWSMAQIATGSTSLDSLVGHLQVFPPSPSASSAAVA